MHLALRILGCINCQGSGIWGVQKVDLEASIPCNTPPPDDWSICMLMCSVCCCWHYFQLFSGFLPCEWRNRCMEAERMFFFISTSSLRQPSRLVRKTSKVFFFNMALDTCIMIFECLNALQSVDATSNNIMLWQHKRPTSSFLHETIINMYPVQLYTILLSSLTKQSAFDLCLHSR